MRAASILLADGRARLWLLLLVLFPFIGLGAPPLFDLDEGAFTAATAEMFMRGDFLSSYLLGEPRHDKPILIYWLQAAAVALFGASEFVWRLPSALASAAWIFLTYAFVRRVSQAHHADSAALAAALIVATAAGLSVITRAATADALLNLWLICAGYASWLWLAEKRRRWLYAAWLAMALGFLTKGPVALVIPAGAVFLWCASRGEWRRFFAWAIAPGPLLLFVAVASPWFIVQTMHEGTGFLRGFFLKHNLSRFDAPMEGHGGTLFYYVPVVLLSLLPHTGLLLLALARLRRFWQDERMRFGLLWFAFAFALFSLSGTKLPHYVYYGYGGLVLVLAQVAAELDGRALQRWLIGLPAVMFFAALLALPAVLQAAAPRLKPDDQALLENLGAVFGVGYWGYCSAALAAIFFMLFWRRPPRLALHVQGLLAGLALAVFLIPSVGEVQQGPIRNAARIAAQLDGPLVLYGINTPSFQTYAGRPVRRRTPESGDIVLSRESRLPRNAAYAVLYRERSYVLLRMH